MKKVEQSISNNCCHCAENKGFTAVKRRDYAGLIFSPLSIELDSTILTGSVMADKPVMAKEVSVEEFSYGFSDGSGFDAGFDVNFE